MSVRPRALALALVIRPSDGALLVSEGFDRVREVPFHRLLGGGIDFGEAAASTVRRELLEEIGVGVHVLAFAGVLENLFEFEGHPGHEIALVFHTAFDDPTDYKRERFSGLEADPVNATWHLVTGAQDELPVYPTGALQIAANEQRSAHCVGGQSRPR